MIALVFTACLTVSPYHCEGKQLTFAETNITPQRCFMYGQMELAKWVGEHPTWEIRKYGCQRVGRYAKA